MSLIRTEFTLRNPRDRTLAPLTVKAMVDTGALHLCIPAHLAIQLKLDKLEDREVTTADGIKHLCLYVGPIEVHFGNRGCFTGALVLGDAERDGRSREPQRAFFHRKTDKNR